MKIRAGKKYLLSSMLIVCAALPALARQVPANDSSAYRCAIEKAVFKKIHKEHYGPRPIDDAYAATVWTQFFRTVDPSSYVFLKGDLDQLSVYKNKIDDEINAGTIEFFDAAYAVYSKRTKEAEAICMDILQHPLNLQQKESVVVWRKNLPFPENETARKETWRKILKYGVLKNYMLLEKADSNKIPGKGVNPALEAKARDKVRNWYAEYFRKANGKDAVNDLFTQYMSVAVMEIDPHSAYTAPKDQSFNSMLTKRYYGIGVELAGKESDFYVKRLMQGGTAYKSGLVKENDKVLAIADGKGNLQAVSGWEASQVTNMIRGDQGTDVTMKLQQPGEQPRTVTIKRDEVIDMESRAQSALVRKDGKTYGYIYLPLFYVDPNGQYVNGAAANIYRELVKLKECGVDGIIMDLRGNGGGSLDEVVGMSGFFIPAGPVTMLKSKDSVSTFSSAGEAKIYDGPLAVLVDESSASASEIFTAVMQDRGRAIIVGTSSTFGKGTAQTSLSMGKLGDPEKGIPDTSYGGMRLTRDKFFRITGTATQLRGVVPDIILQDRMSIESVKEKDLPAVLPYDSIPSASFQRMPFTFDYATVVRKANERIRNNGGLQQVTTNMQRLQALRDQPAVLNIDDFRKSYGANTSLENTLLRSRELPADHYMNVEAAFPKNINPALFKTDPVTEIHQQEWLQKVSKDLYINETISVLEDMLANPAH